jgi:hypothetical protein
MIEPGFAFFNAEAPGVPRHLWFVVCSYDADSAVIVNISTNPGIDNQPCVIQPHEHPGISRLSYLRCDRSRTTTAAALQLAEQKQLIFPAPPATRALLSKLRQGLLASQHTPGGVKEAVRTATR